MGTSYFKTQGTRFTKLEYKMFTHKILKPTAHRKLWNIKRFQFAITRETDIREIPLRTFICHDITGLK